MGQEIVSQPSYVHNKLIAILTGILTFLLALFAFTLFANQVNAAELYNLTPGTVELKSAGPLAFGRSGARA